MVRHIPNVITLLNVFCGCVATVFAVLNQLEYAAFFVFLGIFFDFFDGLAARLLNARSELGLQLDSLADVITSGVVPGIVMFQLLSMALNGGWNVEAHQESVNSMFWAGLKVHPVPFLGFLITMASAYRLARFNLDATQSDSFRGLPTPANALLILSLPLILYYHGNDLLNGIILNVWFLLALTLVSCFLLNSNIRLFALKFKTWGLTENLHRYIFLVLCAVLLLTLKFLAVPFIILLYLGMSASINFRQ